LNVMVRDLSFIFKISILTVILGLLALPVVFSQETGPENTVFEQEPPAQLGPPSEPGPYVDPGSPSGSAPSFESLQDGPSRKISLNVKDMNVVDVLKILSEEGKFNISVSGNVRGRVTLFLKDIDVWEALQIVIASSDLAYEMRDNVISVMAEREYELKYGKKYWDKRRVEILSLKHAQALKVKEVLAQMASKVGKVIVEPSTNTLIVIDVPGNIAKMREVVGLLDKNLVTKVFGLNYLQAKDLQDKTTEILTKDVGSVKIDEASNKIVVTDYPGKMQEIEELIKAFDEKPPQVLIDAKIIELKPNEKFYAGIDWGYWIKQYFGAEGSFSIPTTSGEKLTFGTIGVEDITEPGKYRGIMELLESFGETNILSTPRIMVVNNQEAKIMVGSKDVYITSSVSEVGESAVTTQSINFVDVGMKLFVTPTINRQGYITMKIRPEVSESTRESITSEDKVTEVPIVSTSEAETTVMVRDGVSIIIGGLKKIKTEKETKQVPVLGSIPLLGTLFRSKSDTWEKSDLVIILTPYIVSPDEDSPGLKDVAKLSPLFEGKRKEQVDIYDGRRQEEEAQEIEEAERLEQLLDEVLGEDRHRRVKKIKKEELPPEVKYRQKKAYKRDALSRYYSEIFEKIQSVSSSMRLRKKGKIRVLFSLSSTGELLGEPHIIYTTDKSLEEIGKIIVKKSSPFLPFPRTLAQNTQNFEVLISLE